MRPTRRDEVVAGAWAFAEATLFFVIPDVWLTWVATADRATVRKLVRCVAIGTAMAATGGVFVIVAGLGPLTELVPGITIEDLWSVQQRVRREGMISVTTAWTRGEPYKLYASACGMQGCPVGQFMAWSVVARGWRFGLTTSIAFGVARLVRMQEASRVLWAVVWISIYTVYWWKHPFW